MPAKGSIGPRITLVCERCGKPYFLRPCDMRLRAARFCSRACFQAITVEERFWAKIQKTETCWLWTAATTGGGYGRFVVAPGVHVSAHVYLYEAVSGPVPDGLILRHTCDVRLCVRPDHLIPGTHLDNMADMVERHRHRVGSRHHNAILTESDVATIKDTDCSKRGTMARLAREYGVSPPAILRIVRGDAWKHVKPHDQ